MLQLKDTPGFARDNLVMTYAKHKQVGQHRDAHGFLTPVLIPTDLVLAQSQPRFELPVDQLDRPTLLVDAYHLARRQFGQIGHQEFGVVGAHVPPFFAQYQGDITHMTQTQARVICPKSSAAFAYGLSGNLGALIIFVWQINTFANLDFWLFLLKKRF